MRSVLLDEVLDVCRRHELEGNIDLFVDLIALGELQRGIDRALALTGSILEHGDLQVAGLHGGKRVLRRIDAGDDDLVHWLARSLQRLDGADRHFVVVGDDRVEFETAGEPVGHQVGALGTLPVCSLLLNDLDALAAIGSQNVMNVLRTHAGCLVGQFAHHDDGLALAAEDSANFLGFQRAGFLLVGCDEGLLVRKAVDVGRLAVDVDERDLGVGSQLGDGSRCVGIDRVDDDGIDLTGDEVLDLALLLGNVVLSVFDLQRHAAHALCIVLHAVAQNGQEVVVEQRHGYADRLSMSSGRQQKRHCRAKNEFLHIFLPDAVPGHTPPECRSPRSRPWGLSSIRSALPCRLR
ncbi:hypothetical protein RHSP_77195 [Rhizobium freirei PRF 81]|uniref:NAD-specific glutamate dehydrogenase n=1 Tax=Rhizobium freirei PRF 81 TaxID=363754 RepID=N6U1H2_9HYPH|nr:hypothetical protein RHSP_77195 [Rhizobium freirei PRF 81]